MASNFFVPVAIDVLVIRPGLPDGAIVFKEMERNWNEIDLENSNLPFAPPLKPYLAWAAYKTTSELRRRLLLVPHAELIRCNCRLEEGPEGRPVIAEMVDWDEDEGDFGDPL